VLFPGGVGAHQAENPVGEVGIGGPDFLAVDDEIVAVAFGAGLQRGEIGAGIRLGITLAPADQPGGDFWQVLLFLRIGAVFEQRRPQHRDAEGNQRRPRADRRHLLADDLGLFAIEAAAAIFLRPVRHGPALSRIRSNQTRCGSEENLVLRPPQNVSSSEVIGRRISGGQLASSQARVSRRN